MHEARLWPKFSPQRPVLTFIVWGWCSHAEQYWPWVRAWNLNERGA